MRLFSIAFYFISILLFCSDVSARTKTGDLFYDRHWVYDRPWVPSDKYRSQDVFRHKPTMGSGSGDMFSRWSKTNRYGREDMLPTISLRQPRRYYVLKMDPDPGFYNAR
jgi:hypothetical protein